MQNRTPIKSALILLSALLVTSCSSTPEKVAQQRVASIEPALQTAPSTQWQQAYGENQETEPNALPSTADENAAVHPALQPKPVTDLWQRIRNGYELSDHQQLHAITEQKLKWFISNPDYMERMVERARPYLYHIVEQLDARDMPMEIALLPVVESGFKPHAYSHGRAAGLWQFIPGTGKLYGLKQNWWYDGRRDVIESTRAALDYLQKLHNDFGDWQLALAAYNCGEGTVSRAIKRNQKLGKATDFWSLDLPRETSSYVPKLLAIAHLVSNPEQYNISLSPIDNKPYLAIVDIDSQIDLALAAKMAGIKGDDIYMLNPGFNRWATDPEGPHKLVLPVDKVEAFKTALAEMPAGERVQWQRHQIKSGDSLNKIAHQYKTTVAVIKQANELRSNVIRAGHYLLIPVASGDNQDYALTATQRQTSLQATEKAGRNKLTHTVRSGDTWWDIARTYNVNVNALAKWNGKAPGDMLHPGQKLVVWRNKAGSSTTGLKSIQYTIKDGDSLWAISRRFNVSVAQVREWNGLNDRTLLQPGQNLTLYLDET